MSVDINYSAKHGSVIFSGIGPVFRKSFDFSRLKMRRFDEAAERAKISWNTAIYTEKGALLGCAFFRGDPKHL